MRQLSASRPGATWAHYISPAMWQTGMLFAVDMMTNAADYAFHLYLGRALLPGDFATVQTVNAIALIVVTTFAVMQPVVARYIAEMGSTNRSQASSLFWQYLGQGAILGAGFMGLVWLGQRPLAIWLHLPLPIVTVGAWMLLFALVRPVVAGMLQGQSNFFAFGLTRTAYALGRLGLAFLLIGWWRWGAVGGTAAMPVAALLAFTVGLIFLWPHIWVWPASIPREQVWAGWRLSLAAFLAYAAYMSLLSLDLIWVNGRFPAELAGSYATAVVLRRLLAVLPGAAVVILYPRLVTIVSQQRLPDSLLLKTAVLILLCSGGLTAVYFALGPTIVHLVFGPAYSAAAPLLGWIGLGMLGFSLGSIWLNLFLATRPWPFVGLLALTAVLQMGLLVVYQKTLLQITAVFALTGWLLAVCGLVLYLTWLRPRLLSHAPAPRI